MSDKIKKWVSRYPWLLFVTAGCMVIIIFLVFYIVEKRWLSDVPMHQRHIYHLIRGISSSVPVLIMMALLLFRRKVPVFPAEDAKELESIIEQTDKIVRLKQHAFWFINLRWMAIVVALAIIIISNQIANILPEGNYRPLLYLLAVLAISNVLFSFWARRTNAPNTCIIVQVLSDLMILTGLLHFSGGLENPLYHIYSFHVIISGILLSKRTAYTLTMAACGLIGFMALGELWGFFNHYTILFFPHEYGDMLMHASENGYFVMSRFFPFALVLVCLAYFTTMIMDHLRKNEDRLADMARVASTERQKLNTAIDAAGAGMLLLNRDLEVVWYNRRYEEWFNPTDTLLGHHCNLGKNNGGSQNDCDACLSAQAIEQGSIIEAERKIVTPALGSRFFHVTASPIRNEKGDIVQVVELILDITARKAMEFEMFQAGKMAVLGRMAAGIAHEVGNPLSSLTTRIWLMKSRNDEKFTAESLEVLQQQIGRIKRIIHGISQVARPQTEDWSLCSINGILKEMVDVIRLDRKAKNVAIELVLADSNPSTSGPKDKFFQVFLNIALNAVEAMEGKGKLKIITESNQNDIVVKFEDTGHGLTEESQVNLFNPFYTTKKQGLGLGLFMCYSIINSYGGTMEVESEEDRGATFIIKLPVRDHESNKQITRVL